MTASGTTVGLLHPGAMGTAVGELLVAAGHRVAWAGDERSDETRRRAERARFEDLGSVATLAATADVVISLCPPAAAPEVARSVAAAGFDGLYVDANAVAPATVREIAAMFARTVDGGVVGGPPRRAGTTRLYLSGPEATTVSGLFAGSVLECIVLGERIGAASALKASFAGWTKGSAALLVALRAFARQEGVDDALVAEWQRSLPDVLARSERSASLGAKAWRFEGELREIADALGDHGLPTGFHTAAAEVYARLVDLRHHDDVDLAELVDRLVGPDTSGGPETPR